MSRKKQVKVSKHAAKLIELGFEHAPEDLEAYSLLSRTERRSMQNGKLPPSFTQGTESLPLTYATDECGQTWMIWKNLDLKSLEFRENTQTVNALEKRLRESDRRYN